MNSFSTLWNRSMYLYLRCIVVHLEAHLAEQMPNGVVHWSGVIFNLIGIVNSHLRKLCHFMYLNQCMRTHFPCRMQSCTPAGLIHHILSPPGNWQMRGHVWSCLILGKLHHVPAVSQLLMFLCRRCSFSFGFWTFGFWVSVLMFSTASLGLSHVWCQHRDEGSFSGAFPMLLILGVLFSYGLLCLCLGGGQFHVFGLVWISLLAFCFCFRLQSPRLVTRGLTAGTRDYLKMTSSNKTFSNNAPETLEVNKHTNKKPEKATLQEVQ